MAGKTDEFLSLYRTYENLVRAAGMDPKDLEDGMAEPKASEFRMIRQFRNFLSHTEAPGFLEPTGKMLDVLAREVRDWTMRGDVAKKHLRMRASMPVLDESEKCAAGLERMAKARLDRLMVRRKDGTCFLCDVWSVAMLASSSRAAKLSTAKVLRERPAFVPPDEPMERIDPDRFTVCTDDGTPTGKILGVVRF